MKVISMIAIHETEEKLLETLHLFKFQSKKRKNMAKKRSNKFFQNSTMPR